MSLPPRTEQRPPISLDAAARLPLRDHVRQQLRIAIISGQFRSGERLNERALAEEMNISTTPLKEALRQLEAEGLIEVLPRRGIVVRFDAAFAEEMILARAALEAPLAALAADRSDDETRQRLADTVKRMRAATQEADIVQLIGLNEVFHGLIHAAARSVHLTRLVASQQFYDESARRVIHRNAEESRTALDEHAAISEAIIDGNRELAATRMSAHVLRSGALYLHAVFGTTLEAPLDH